MNIQSIFANNKVSAIVAVLTACASLWTSPEAAAQSNDAAKIETILTRLEKRSDGLKDIQCKVRFSEEDKINLSKGLKIGTIKFLITETNPVFMIHFERSERDGIIGKQLWFLFDGRYLHEGNERIRQVTVREVAKPGETLDLFDLEKAPFPMPFGQKKDTILRNFDVTLAAPQQGDPQNTDHLVCVPKPDSAFYRQYDRFEFFVHRTLHLPTKVVVVKNRGLEINTAEFPDLSERSINTGLTKKSFSKPKAWKKFKEVIDP